MSLSVILPVVVGLSAILIMLVRLGIASQRRQPITGSAGMIGEPGRAHRAPSRRAGRAAWRRTARSGRARNESIGEADRATEWKADGDCRDGAWNERRP